LTRLYTGVIKKNNMFHKVKDISGNKYGKLTVLKYDKGSKGSGKARWICECDCGNKTIARTNSLTSGHTQSCGCLSVEKSKSRTGEDHQNYKHGDKGTKFYNTFQNIKWRCNNESADNYHRYGGRGIECEWDSYIQFKKDMIDSYRDHIEEHGKDDTTIDRINNDGNYKKANCRWATNKQQNRNRNDNHMLTFGGETKCMMQWVEDVDIEISYHTLSRRIIRYDWSTEKALTTPVQGQSK